MYSKITRLYLLSTYTVCFFLFFFLAYGCLSWFKYEEKHSTTDEYYDWKQYEQQECIPPSNEQQYDNRSANDILLYIYKYFSNSEYKNIALDITAMSALETSWWKSQFHRQRNNYWSTKKIPDRISCHKGSEKGCFATYNSLEHACKKMYHLLKKKQYSTEREQFLEDLKRKNFAEDSNYINKVIATRKSVERKLQTLLID